MNSNSLKQDLNKMASLNDADEPKNITRHSHHDKSHDALLSNGDANDIIDEDINHTVGRLFSIQPQRNNLMKNKRENIEEIVSRALQAERNHWKDRLQLSMQEIDRQHRIILSTHSGLQDLVKSLKHTRRKSTILEEEESDSQDIDHEAETARLLETLKFQIRHLKVRGGVNEVSSTEIEESKMRQRLAIKELKDKIKELEDQTNALEVELINKSEKINFLQKENASLLKQLQKLQKIVGKYNETHSGTNFHLNTVQRAQADKTFDKSHDRLHDRLTDKLSEKRRSRETLSTLDLSEGSTAPSAVRERTYLEGDQMVSYPNPKEESAIIKDRIRRSIYSARKADYRSSNVAQCLRCQTLFKPAENTHRSCRFHHKGREITEQFQGNGKLDKVVYKWACCKKPLEVAGCCYGYHV